MAISEDIVLKFEIVPGRAPKLESVARALAAWEELIRTAAEIADPASTPLIQLVAVESGSQIFAIAFRKLVEFGELVSQGAEEYPLPTKAAVALSSMITGGLIGVGLQAALLPPPRIPDDQMAEFKRTNELLEESNDLQRRSQEVWGVAQEEPAFDAVKVFTGVDRILLYEVPRSEFATRAGVWGQEAEAPKPVVETRTATWDVTLIKPVLVAEPRRWVFAREGLKFSALMSDKRVLTAIHDKTLPIQVAEGVSMKIEIQYKERYDGEAWVPVDQSQKVIRVLSPLPPTRIGPLFLESGGPEE